MSSDYPLEELVKIKQKRFEQAVKLIEEKKTALKRENDILKNLEDDRNKVFKHKEDKLQQLRDALDSGERTDKIRQKKDYLEVVKENLKEKDKKVANQLKNVKEAENDLEKARQNLLEKQKDIEK
ncbi:MAG: type III secretion T3S chaperone, partial [Parachlamydiales bacterium]